MVDDSQKPESSTTAVTTENVTIAADTQTGNGVPDKLQGKSLDEVQRMYLEAEKARTKAEQERSQWQDFAANKLKALENRVTTPQPVQQQEPPMDPQKILSAFDQEQLQALGFVLNNALNPIFDGLGSIQREIVKSRRPDYDKVKEKAEEYYQSMPPQFKFNPKYGMDFAYRLAKAEADDGGSPNSWAMTPPSPGPSAEQVERRGPKPLNDDQKFAAKIFGMSDEQYRQYMTPIDVTERKK